jgi:YVTN family beta-propeller protein
MKRLKLSPLYQAVLIACSSLAAFSSVNAGDSDHSLAMRDDAQAAQTYRTHKTDGKDQLPTGQFTTPLAVPGAVQQYLNPQFAAYPDFVAGGAVRAQLSPDGKTLAILCAGQNTLYDASGKADKTHSTQYIFLYDVAGANEQHPLPIQVIQQTNAFVGLVWSPDGKTLYAAGGNDDAVYAYTESGGSWAQSAKIALGHNGKGLGLGVQPNAGGLAISMDGKKLVVANNYNDSISVIDTTSNTVLYEHDLRPFDVGNEGTSGVAGGTYPFAVAMKGNGIAYVSSSRDREVDVIDVSSSSEANLIARVKLDGNPLGMTLDKAQNKLYVAQDNADQVAVIDTDTNEVIDKIDTRGAALFRGIGRPHYTGAAAFAVTLSPDGKTLYAVNNGANSVAVIPLHAEHSHVAGLIPTAYAPTDIGFSHDGKWMYIINGKSQTGPNPGHLYGNTALLTTYTYPGGNAQAAADAKASNQYQFQLERSSLLTAPVPTLAELMPLTRQVAINNFYNAGFTHDDEVMEFLHRKIKHVIYIVKENRTFDQVLGDLGNGSNGDPSLAIFGKTITPNFHNLAGNFVTLDNFMDPGDGSMDGWSWATRGRVTSTEAITQQINYAGVNRGLSYESEGGNRNVPVGLATTAERDAASNGAFSAGASSLPGGSDNLLVGTADHSSTDAPYGEEQGYIFDAALHAGLSVRNYGFLVHNIGSIGTIASPIADPYSAGEVEVAALNPGLVGITDVYYRGYDQSYPDLWRYNEWKREFNQFVANGKLPSLSLVRLSHDHTGNFSSALAGVNTPETQQADDDLAVGKLVEAVAHSPYAKDTLIIITEDDSQDGPDHVDSHRTTTYMVGPYVKKNAIVSTRYGQVNALRTIEDILGTPHINLNTAYQSPMDDVFDITASPEWTYTAVASTVLSTTQLELDGVQYAKGAFIKPKHDAVYWAKATTGFDFSHADRVPPALYNKVLWQGLMEGKPYPVIHNGSHSAALDREDDAS